VSKLLERRSKAPPSIALQEVMLRYAQNGSVVDVAGAIRKGADPDYKQGAALEISVYMGHFKLTKYLLRVSKQYDKQKLLDIAQRMQHTKLVALINKEAK
jgi:hypothetical protein